MNTYGKWRFPEELFPEELNEYKRAGAMMRLLRDMATVARDNTEYMGSDSLVISYTVIEAEIENICAELEDRMYGNFPALPREYISVFYGTLNRRAIHRVDEEIIQTAKEVSDEIFFDRRNEGHD